MEQAYALLNNVKSALKEELNNSVYNNSFADLNKIHKVQNGNIYLIVPTKLEEYRINQFYLKKMNEFLNQYTTEKMQFQLITQDAADAESVKNAESVLTTINPQEKVINERSLRPEYTFNNFITGESNREAFVFALKVAQSPHVTVNPLYIFGDVGLGKTHLMMSIGNYMLENNPKLNIVCTSAQRFVEDYFKSKNKNQKSTSVSETFNNYYRSADVLLVDDVQFIAGKERIQEEFFHTFNTLYEDRKQIILSSDKPPRDIPFLEDRLKSRFEWGLLADISCPDYETRLAILRKKAQDENILIDDFILSNIATKIDSNIRELEGVFNKIVARASLIHSPISIEFAENIINEFKAESEKVISCDFIKETVAKYFSIDPNDLSGNKRSAEIAFPRQIAMYLCREVANMSFPKIGADFGNRDHSTVMHAYKKIQKEVKEKNNTKLIVESVKNIITDTKQ